jgi:hypothetical protein
MSSILVNGAWEGFFLQDDNKHPMSCHFTFFNGIINGRSEDEVGKAIWRGSYDTQTLKVEMTKNYSGHSVEYSGYADENGIWGKWIIDHILIKLSGGFHIWPLRKNISKQSFSKSKAVTKRNARQKKLVAI